MARPKNTASTKWIIHHEEWFPNRKQAAAEGKRSKLPYEVTHVEGARTPFGSYRRNQWRLRTFWPSLYRGKKPLTAPLTAARAKEVKKFHPNSKLVKIRGGSYIYISTARAELSHVWAWSCKKKGPQDPRKYKVNYTERGTRFIRRCGRKMFLYSPSTMWAPTKKQLLAGGVK